MLNFFKNIINYWDFYLENFKLAVFSILFGSVLIIFDLIFKFQFLKIIDPTIEQILISIGSGSLIVGLFNIIYEVKTKENFITMVSQVNQTLKSGVIIHQSHDGISSRKESLENFLLPNETIRIMTSTADNYVRNGEEPRYVLERKILYENCKIFILLHFPVNSNIENIGLGQGRKNPNRLITEQKILYEDYKSLMNLNPNNVIIRFFTVPLHLNLFMIGKERLYGAPIFHSISSRELPCYEMFPTGSKSIFYKYLNEFNQIFEEKDKTITLDFEEVFSLYQESNYSFDQLKSVFCQKYLCQIQNEK